MIDGGTERELSATIAQLVQRLKGSHLHSQLERRAKDCLHQPEIKLESLKEDVRHFLRVSGWEKKLHNAVYREMHVQPPLSLLPTPPEHRKEPLLYMRSAQASWERRVLKSLSSMSSELGVPLARKRPAAEQKELANKWNEMSTDEPDLSQFRPVYAPKDFLEVLIGLRNPNHDHSEQVSTRSHWGLIQLPLSVRDCGSDVLGLNVRSYCGSDVLGLNVRSYYVFESQHVEVGKKVVLDQDSAAAQQYSRQGCPMGLRADLWALILNATNQAQDMMHYEQLKAGVIQHDMLVDNLIYKDVKLTASNDDYYFVFEDFLYQVLMCFSRDTAILEHFMYNSASPPRSFIQGGGRGVIPFHGFSMYVAPLCFLYNSPSELYSVFREMYVRYFFRLHSVSSSPSGIVSLCLQFERLLQAHLPQLFYHLRQIGAQPLRIAFRWMVRAFSGYLSTDQLLLLWDRLLAYDSLEILAVLAAAVFAFRSDNLMEVTSLASAEAVLADLSTLKVMPLIQIFLFASAA
uniref:TBC1 domain family, member 19 n=1 Tax=Gadus morhua TaxID=8049 RepID=A0A8C4ZTW1_GADMO